jgi:glycosyltransferase involved in cell wall biosynthesis
MTRILLVHNRYRSEMASGENRIVDQEAKLLRDGGHTVIPFIRESDEIARFGLLDRARLPARVVWSEPDRRELLRLARRTRPDVVHIHNTFPLISPSVVYAAAQSELPIVMTLHNFRLFCANGLLFRDGHICESCLGSSPLPGLAHACYRGSRVATAPITANIALHHRLGTWEKVAAFIVLSEFARKKVAAGGLPDSRLVVKSNSVPTPRAIRDGPGQVFVYLGRLSREKGPDLLASAWSPDLGTLMMLGDGPEREDLERRVRHLGDSVRLLGHRSPEECFAALLTARAVIIPSRVYEGFPVTVAEAFAHGVPVIAPDHGPFPEIIENGLSGLLFRPGDPADIRRQVERLSSDDLCRSMGREARRAYEDRYTPDRNLAELESVYARVVEAGSTARAEAGGDRRTVNPFPSRPATRTATLSDPVSRDPAATWARLFPAIGPVTAGALFHGVEGAAPPPDDPEAWRRELPLLIRHRLAGLALAASAAVGVELAYDVRERLHASNLNTTARSIAVESTAIEVLEAFEGMQIPHVITKGPGIARAYGDPSTRPYGDLDILVAPERFEDALASVAGIGFGIYFEGGEPRSYFDRYCREGVNLVRGDGGSVDLHHRIPPWVWGQRLVFDRLLERSTEIAIAGGKALALAPEHNLIVASLHVISDRGLRPGYKLITWRDLVALAAVAAPENVAAEAKRARLDWFVGATLRELPRSVQPQELLRALPRAQPPPGDLFRLRRLLPPAVGSKHQIAQAFRLPIPNACAFLAGYVFPSRAFLTNRYGDSGGYVRWWREASGRLRDAREADEDAG